MENDVSPGESPTTTIPPMKEPGSQTVRNSVKNVLAYSYPNRGPSAYGSYTNRTNGSNGVSMLMPSTGLSKSAEMLKDLQQYISSIEHLAAQRKIEVERLQDQRREQERRMRMPWADRASERTPSLGRREDDPTYVRALREDIKVMKERVRKYKERCATAERGAATANQQLLRLQDKYSQLESALSMTHRTQGQIMDEKRVRDECDAKDSKIEDLERKIAVLLKSKDVQAKRHKTEMNEQRKEIDELGKEVVRLQGCIGLKDKEVRTEVLKVKSLQRKMDPIRRHLALGHLGTALSSPGDLFTALGYTQGPFGPGLKSLWSGDGSGGEEGSDTNARPDDATIIRHLEHQILRLQASLDHYRERIHPNVDRKEKRLVHVALFVNEPMDANGERANTSNAVVEKDAEGKKGHEKGVASSNTTFCVDEGSISFSLPMDYDSGHEFVQRGSLESQEASVGGRQRGEADDGVDSALQGDMLYKRNVETAEGDGGEDRNASL